MTKNLHGMLDFTHPSSAGWGGGLGVMLCVCIWWQ